MASSRVTDRTWWLVLLLVLIEVAVFAPVWNHAFLDIDDPDYVVRNPQVAAGLTWQGIVWAFTTGHSANWHPLTWLSHMLDVELFGMRPGPHHLTSLALHVASTLLLFGVLTRMTGQAGRSAVVAALFGVHPLHVESVAWVAERKDVLSTLFWMLTLWAYEAYVRRPRPARYLAVAGLFALGLMAKPMLVTLPFVLLLLDFWPLGRMSGGSARPIAPRAALRLVAEKVPLLALTLASSVVTYLAQERAGVVGGLEAFPFGQRLANALVSYVVYIGKMLWPAGLAAIYPYPHAMPLWWIAGSALLLIAVTAAAVGLARRAPYLAVGWFWYLGTLVPVIGLVQVGLQSMAADRYTYVPLIGLFVVVAWGVPAILDRRSWARGAVLPAAAAVAVVACAIVAGQQVRYWRDRVTLWERTVAVTRDNHLALVQLAGIRASEGRFDEAVALYTAALRIKPDYAEAHNNLGFTLARRGRHAEAMTHYAEAVRIRPGFAAAYNNLGLALLAQGKVDEAVAAFRDALRAKPDDAETHFNLAVVLEGQGRSGEAVGHYAEAIRANPGHPEAHYRLGILLAARGQKEEAIRQLEIALRVNPRSPKVRQALGELTGRRDRPR